MSGTPLLVTGGRDFCAPTFVEHALDALHAKRPVSVLIEGEAKGADTCARDWAKARGIPVEAFPVTGADWQRLGKRAGHLRNAAMLARLVELGGGTVAALPGGRGTDNMVKQARDAGVPVVVAAFEWRHQ